MARSELERIAHFVRERAGVTLVDEIYLGLSYDEAYGHSALGLPDGLGDQIISINSFSKYFNMTGWRLGWMVVPEAMVPVVERLAQNLFICASTVSQHAALACFEAESIAEYERRRAEFKARRDYFIPELQRLGLSVPVLPDGAFYAFANFQGVIGKKAGINNDIDLCEYLLNEVGVALVPGSAFGLDGHMRISYATAMSVLEDALGRIRKAIEG